MSSHWSHKGLSDLCESIACNDMASVRAWVHSGCFEDAGGIDKMSMVMKNIEESKHHTTGRGEGC